MPSIDPSPMESGDRRNRCTCAVVCRYFVVELHCLRAAAVILFISSKKRKGARKTFTCAIYARGARRQRYSEDWVSVGADTWRLVSVGCPTDAARRREAGCTDTLLCLTIIGSSWDFSNIGIVLKIYDLFLLKNIDGRCTYLVGFFNWFRKAVCGPVIGWLSDIDIL